VRATIIHVGLLAALLLSACGSPAPASDTPFADDFSDPGSGWSTTDTEQLSISYEDGALHFRVDAPDTAAWAVAGKRAGNFILDVDATQVEGPDNNHYGVVVRYADAQGAIRQASRQFSGQLPPNGVQQWASGLGPFTTVEATQVGVASARVVGQ